MNEQGASESDAPCFIQVVLRATSAYLRDSAVNLRLRPLPSDREGRIDHLHERLLPSTRGIEPQKEQPDAGCALHEAGLRGEEVGADAVLGLDPLQPFAFFGRAREDVVGGAAGDGEVRGIARRRIKGEEEFADACATAALADVVPVAV